jgi:hypothetical protein
MNDMINSISPVDTWKDGISQSATKLLLRVIADDLYSQAMFYYALLNADNEMITSGNLAMTGTDYTTWNTSANATPGAFTWAADQLNLTLS